MPKVSYPMFMRSFLFILCLSTFYFGKAYAQLVPLPNAHAHNDYLHTHPLHDALAQGFTSIEADVLLIEGELYVGHDMPREGHQLPTLKAAYLEPLLKIVKENNGQIYPGYEQPVYLMIDLKTAAAPTYNVLKKQLTDFQEMLVADKEGKLTKGAVRIFLSGNRPTQLVYNENVKWAGIDGRPEDIGKGYDASFMPVVSENHFKVVQWDGTGEIPSGERQKLEKLIEKVHGEGKKLRLWASPDNENTWKTLLDAGVDLINTDQLEGLHNFLKDYKAE
jgi:hypothetical protein